MHPQKKSGAQGKKTLCITEYAQGPGLIFKSLYRLEGVRSVLRLIYARFGRSYILLHIGGMHYAVNL